MARLDGMALTIDLDHYLRLPRGVKARFDAWLDAETLIDKRIVVLTLAEGEVIVERDVIVEREGEPSHAVREIARYPVRSLPPREAFER